MLLLNYYILLFFRYGLRPWLPARVLHSAPGGWLELALDPACDPRASAGDKTALTFNVIAVQPGAVPGQLRVRTASALRARAATSGGAVGTGAGGGDTKQKLKSKQDVAAQAEGDIVFIQPTALSWTICCAPKPPPPPSYPTLLSKTRSSVTVEWSASESPGPPVLGFEMQVRGFGRANRAWRTLEKDTLTTTRCITNLIQGNEYVTMVFLLMDFLLLVLVVVLLLFLFSFSFSVFFFFFLFSFFFFFVFLFLVSFFFFFFSFFFFFFFFFVSKVRRTISIAQRCRLVAAFRRACTEVLAYWLYL